MRVQINRTCNVVTGEHAKGYVRRDGYVRPQVTLPGYRLRLTIEEAEGLAHDLTEAAAAARKVEAETVPAFGGAHVKETTD